MRKQQLDNFSQKKEFPFIPKTQTDSTRQLGTAISFGNKQLRQFLDLLLEEVLLTPEETHQVQVEVLVTIETRGTDRIQATRVQGMGETVSTISPIPHLQIIRLRQTIHHHRTTQTQALQLSM